MMTPLASATEIIFVLVSIGGFAPFAYMHHHFSKSRKLTDQPGLENLPAARAHNRKALIYLVIFVICCVVAVVDAVVGQYLSGGWR